jgi:hypothetical protein
MGDRHVICPRRYLQRLLQPEGASITMTIQFPITVKSIKWDEDAGPISPDRFFGAKAGAWVAVRPVNDEKTYLGVMLGDYRPPSIAYRPETGALIVRKQTFGNPAMWVPDLNRVVMGWESWWGEFRTPDDLRQITNADIENVWYVKALKTLSENSAKPDSQS